MPPCPTELPLMLSLLKVERQIDSDQLIFVQGIQGAESRAETRGERRRQSREQNAGRDESRAPAETKRLSKERRKAREKTTSNDHLKLDLVLRALVYRESATAVVVWHVESDLHEHANGCRKKRTSTLLAPLT